MNFKSFRSISVFVFILLLQFILHASEAAKEAWSPLVFKEDVSGWSLEEAVERLSKTRFVGCGNNVSSTLYSTLFYHFLNKGSTNDFKEMTESEHPTVRCMGLHLLTYKNDPELESIGMTLIYDNDIIAFGGGGSIILHMSVGDIALRCLLGVSSILMPGHENVSLLSVEEEVNIYVDILSDDESYTRFEHVAWNMQRLFDTDAIAMNTYGRGIALDPYSAPIVKGEGSQFKMIKAIGRLPLRDQFEEYLFSEFNREENDLKIRMAAISALTRYASEAIYAGLLQWNGAKVVVDEDGYPEDVYVFPEGFAIQIKTDMLYTIQYKKHMSYHDIPNSYSFKDAEERSVLAISTPHPVAFEHVWDIRMDDIPGVSEGRKSVLMAIARNAQYYAEPWNTYSHIPLVIKNNITEIGMYDTEHEKLSKVELVYLRHILGM